MEQTDDLLQESQGSLRAIMGSLIRGANDRPGFVGRTLLRGGLEIAVLCREAGHMGKAAPGWMSVQLGRASVAPSDAEIQTVCRALPFEVELPAYPKRFIARGWHYARVTFGWPRPAPAQLTIADALEAHRDQ